MCHQANQSAWSWSLSTTPPQAMVARPQCNTPPYSGTSNRAHPSLVLWRPKTPRPHLPWLMAASSFIFIISPEPSTHLVAVFGYLLLSSFRLLPPSCAHPSQHILVACTWLFLLLSFRLPPSSLLCLLCFLTSLLCLLCFLLLA